MLDLIKAEWLKIYSNVRLTASLVWIFPIGAATIFIVGIAVNMITGEFSGYTNISSWTSDVVLIWGFINQFPGNVSGRLLPLAFMAVIFAGEFQWGTWKNIVPRSRRGSLFIAKLIAVTLVLLFSLALTSLVILLFQWIGHQLLNEVYGPALTLRLLLDTVTVYLQEALIAAFSLLLLGSFAAVAGFMTRSILGALLLTFGFSIVEILSLAVLVLLSNWFNNPDIVNAYRYMPSYNLENLRAWFVTKEGWTDLPLNIVIEAGMAESFIWVGVWIALIAGWAFSIFQRQDLVE